LTQTAALAFVVFGALSLLSCGREGASAGSAPPPIEIRATLHPAQSLTITSQIDGQVSVLAVRDGAKVTAGSEIARLQNPAVERDAAYARAQREWVEARLRRGSRPAAAPNQPRGNLEIAAKILELKRKQYETMKSLRKGRDVTAREVEQAEVEYLAAQRDYNNERRAAAGVPVLAEDPAALKIEQQKIVAEERFATQREKLLRVTTPIGGVVTRVHVTAGQGVFPRDPIADVSDNTIMQVRGNLAPELLRYVRPGMRVDVKILTVPPRTFADEIDSILPAQQGAGRGATVIANIPNPDGSLHPNTEAVITLRSLR
jgi:cobalt-zinc-cadmium efflux system membrane fusion protein